MCAYTSLHCRITTSVKNPSSITVAVALCCAHPEVMVVSAAPVSAALPITSQWWSDLLHCSRSTSFVTGWKNSSFKSNASYHSCLAESHILLSTCTATGYLLFLFFLNLFKTAHTAITNNKHDAHLRKLGKKFNSLWIAKSEACRIGCLTPNPNP